MMRTALVALLAGAVLTVLTGCGIRIMKYEFQDDHVVAEKFTSVRVRTGSGEVSIRYQQGLTETKIHRKVEHLKDNRPSGVSHRVEGTSLSLDECGNNCSIDYLRARPHRETSETAETLDQLARPPQGPSMDDLVYAGQIGERVQAALGELSPQERAAFLMRHYQGCSIEEICQALGLKTNAAKHSIFRAVKKMRVALRPLMDARGMNSKVGV